ncbi:hypothetical protein DVB69_15850 [Sporosarcina sp. BI001-red]|uniref:hypothetical protein n=1 Tax=Sporosarcina sp. BI001-red TaxID=2282866 RepID=UPI000E2792D6|nr:hypothetical protein [Sporosarcina sp. BI001-red]REB05228.1 hypothetical protein DVB69_15850 [Sporosarcina sp. BI001-red]
MKKFMLSLLGGSLLGILLSFIFMDYQKISYEVLHQAGVAKRTVKDVDFDFVFNASLLILGFTVVIYVIWTYIEKKKDDAFYNGFNKK